MTVQNNYWEKRIANNIWELYNKSEIRNRELLKAYQKVSDDITKNLYKLSEKINNGEILTRSEMYRNNRLRILQKKYSIILKDLATGIEKKVSNDLIKGMEANAKNIADQLGYEFTVPNKGIFEQTLKEPWKGSNFSKRLWKNTGKLNQELNNILVTGLAQGKTVTQMAIQLNNVMNKGFNNAHRLIRTETMHYLNQSSLQTYKEAGVKKVQFWAAEDERTCEICGVMHGKEYDIDKAPILPLHPLCRCCYLPVIEGINDDGRMYKKALKNEPEISKDIKKIAKKEGFEIAGFKYRLKTKESYLRKVKNKKQGYIVNDIIRYTYISEPEKLVTKTLKTLEVYKDEGYNIIVIKNSWVDDFNPYNGINTVLESSSGQTFELQFHTKESFDLKNGKLHELYEKARVLNFESKEYIELEEKMFQLSSRLKTPKNIKDVK
jgi:SPP1 gp7 family putative phage head morphogenesis protein